MTEEAKQRPSQFAETIMRMVRNGMTDNQVIAAHSFGWRERAARRLCEVRAAISRAEGTLPADRKD